MTRTTTPPLRLLERFVNSTPAPTTTSGNVGQTMPKPSANNKRPTPIIIYPTVTPESIVVPIVSCIFGFPLLALTVICCLRRRAKLARYCHVAHFLREEKGSKRQLLEKLFLPNRERARRRNCELDRGELSVVKLSPVKCKQRAVSLVRSPRAPPTLELDTVLEERSDPEQTTLSQVEVTPDREVGTILFGAVGAMGTAAATAATAAAAYGRDS